MQGTRVKYPRHAPRASARPRGGAARARSRSGALAEARLDALRNELAASGGRLLLRADRKARWHWNERGLSLAQRDRAVEELVALGEARVKPTPYGVAVERGVA
jgi:hypothetical protein